MSRTRATWTIERLPQCWNPALREDWIEWIRLREGAPAPCVDCCARYQQQMLAAGRCERPETQFVTRDGECVGVSADDPAFAKLVPKIPMTAEWSATIWRLRDRRVLHPKIADAITRWLRTYASRQERKSA